MFNVCKYSTQLEKEVHLRRLLTQDLILRVVYIIIICTHSLTLRCRIFFQKSIVHSACQRIATFHMGPKVHHHVHSITYSLMYNTEFMILSAMFINSDHFLLLPHSGVNSLSTTFGDLKCLSIGNRLT